MYVIYLKAFDENLTDFKYRLLSLNRHFATSQRDTFTEYFRPNFYQIYMNSFIQCLRCVTLETKLRKSMCRLLF